jgi:magnesium transporter
VSPRRTDFAIVQGHLAEVSLESASVTVFANPNGQEQRALVELSGIFSGIDEHTLASALDPDEISRLEFDDDARETIIVWKRPRRGGSDEPELLGLASLGMFLQSEHLTFVTADDAPLLRAGDRADSLRNVLLRVMAATANEFLVELKTVKRTSQQIAKRLSESLDNRELLRMFSLSEGLVYHIHAMEANAGVLRRLHDLADRLGFDEADVALLDDVIIDNNQAIRQGQIFSAVLGGLMDARGNVINNNMNVLLRNLTMINVVFLPLGVLASMGGMSEFTMMIQEYGIDWRIGYPLFTVAMVALGAALWVAVRSWTTQMFSR